MASQNVIQEIKERHAHKNRQASMLVLLYFEYIDIQPPDGPYKYVILVQNINRVFQILIHIYECIFQLTDFMANLFINTRKNISHYICLKCLICVKNVGTMINETYQILHDSLSNHKNHNHCSNKPIALLNKSFSNNV